MKMKISNNGIDSDQVKPKKEINELESRPRENVDTER
jgi:hypothetical protein